MTVNMEIWGDFSQEDVGKKITISGCSGPRWFYRPVFSIKKKITSRLPLLLQVEASALWMNCVPRGLKRVIEKALYKPSVNSGSYVIKEVLDGQVSVVRK